MRNFVKIAIKIRGNLHIVAVYRDILSPHAGLNSPYPREFAGAL